MVSGRLTAHLLRWLFLIVLLTAALGLRWHVAQMVPLEVDEDNYLSPGVDLRRGLAEGNWRVVTQIKRNFEHPPLVKLLYGATLDQAELDALPQKLRPDSMEAMPKSLERARWQNILGGVLAVLVVALMNPLAGVMLALQSMHVYYTGIAYLDGLPVLFTALMAVCHSHALRHSGRLTGYFWLAAGWFGLAVACKYPFAWVGVGIIAHALWMRLYSLKQMILWGLAAMLIFFAANPFLWVNTFERLEAQLTFHGGYAFGRHYSPLVPWGQMLFPRGDIRYDEGLLLPWWVDAIIFLLALPGGYLLLRQKSFYGWWLAVGMIFQMLWPTQWIQHNMIIIVPYCIGAALAARRFYEHREIALAKVRTNKSAILG